MTWNGILGDISPDPGTLLSASTDGELYREFIRRLVAALDSPDLPDPGPYTPTMNLELDLSGVVDPNVLAGGLGFGPYATDGCTAIACGDEPLRAPLADNPGCLWITCLGPAAPHRGD